MEPLELNTPSIADSAFIAPGTHIYGDVHIGEAAVIMFGTVIRAEVDRIRIGDRTNIQDNSVLHCDEGIPCTVGSDVTVGHMAMLHGTTVGDHCLIGIGSTALNGSVIGEGAWLAAGSLLPEGKEIPAWTIAMGTPAKPVRELTDDEIERQRSGVANYLRFGTAYRRLIAGP
jgi:carbonic anhydrase/acetyltransferase-like protein (isoleucine patch superfamily)